MLLKPKTIFELTARTHRNPNFGCIHSMNDNNISKVFMSPENRSRRSMYCTCRQPEKLSVRISQSIHCNITSNQAVVSLFENTAFIHSFILAISIVPLQVHYYSEALPTTARMLYRSYTPKRTGNCK